MLELEITYLAKTLPKGLGGYPYIELMDIYIPREAAHPHLRLRKKGNSYEMTKKTKVSEDDASAHMEETISLDEEEFNALAGAEGKRVCKFRYEFPYNGRIAEIDIFQDELEGLVVVDFEFKTREELEAFAIPSFCLVDVTQEEFIAGGMLCGKAYADIEENLKRFGYEKMSFNSRN